MMALHTYKSDMAKSGVSRLAGSPNPLATHNQNQLGVGQAACQSASPPSADSYSSSCQSQSIPSSMETVPTDCVDGYFSGEDAEETPAWGRMFPLGSSFTSQDLLNEEYTFGRGEMCDYQFNTPAMRKHACFQAYSKIHFKLTREKTSTGAYTFLTDLSANGVFINGQKVGKGNKQVLNNNDEVALALVKNKAFMYMDAAANEEKDLPEELKEKYTLAKTLGKGACGEVKLAFEKGSCRKFAVKIVGKKKFTIGGKHQMNTSVDVAREVNIIKDLRHPCIIKVEDVVDTPDTLYIVLELVEGGELFDRVVELGQFEEYTAKLLFYQMAHAIKYLHDQGITHRDLKPENILLSSDSTSDTLVKVTDFGLSKFVDAASMMKTFCGTPNYLAPEILLTAGSSAYTEAIDVWSLGVILFICLVGYPPFSDDRGDMELAKQIVGGHYSFPKEHWSGISEPAIDLVKKLLTVDPKKRYTMDDTLKHPWLCDDDMVKAAHKLMYPETAGMGPPTTLPKKRKGEGSQEENSPKKKV